MQGTPGVYIQEQNAFPNSVAAVATAVPVFIGYTQKAERYGQSLLHVPTRISSFAEYVNLFGRGFNAQFTIIAATAGTNADTFLINGENRQVSINDNNILYFYPAIRLFYLNGGADCYILSVGTYGDQPGSFEIDLTDFTGSDTKPNVFSILEKEAEPTLVLLPDLAASGTSAYPVYRQALEHCNKMQSRMAIFDVCQSSPPSIGDDVQQFRDGIGTNFLKYGAAYYPWLKTTVVQDSEIDFTSLDTTVKLEELLPEAAAKQAIAAMKLLDPAALQEKRATIHQSLVASSSTYVSIMNAIKSALNLLPPAAAIAGIYTMVDNTRGVWKAPANVSVAAVTAPAAIISSQQQETMNVDPVSGKSINIIRSFPGVGTLVWGARTLDGNSQDWRYINVSRTLIMIEQSLKLACSAYIFEPNTAVTWVTMKSMMENFLINLWRQGALAGTVPGQAFSVQIGSGITMTAADIVEGILRVTVLVAVTRPAEFIEITFQQQQATA